MADDKEENKIYEKQSSTPYDDVFIAISGREWTELWAEK